MPSEDPIVSENDALSIAGELKNATYENVLGKTSEILNRPERIFMDQIIHNVDHFNPLAPFVKEYIENGSQSALIVIIANSVMLLFMLYLTKKFLALTKCRNKRLVFILCCLNFTLISDIVLQAFFIVDSEKRLDRTID